MTLSRLSSPLGQSAQASRHRDTTPICATTITAAKSRSCLNGICAYNSAGMSDHVTLASKRTYPSLEYGVRLAHGAVLAQPALLSRSTTCPQISTRDTRSCCKRRIRISSALGLSRILALVRGPSSFRQVIDRQKRLLVGTFRTAPTFAAERLAWQSFVPLFRPTRGQCCRFCVVSSDRQSSSCLGLHAPNTMRKDKVSYKDPRRDC